MHAYTYSAHPAGCAVALRTIQFIEEHDIVAQTARKGAYLLEGLRARLGTHPHVGEIRGKGLMCAVEFARGAAARVISRPRSGGRGLDNDQLVPRIDLMERLLQLWSVEQ